MKLTSARTATVITLVDAALGRDYQPVPPRKMTHIFDSYHVEGGLTYFVPHGASFPAVSPVHLEIAQADDTTAKALYRQLEALAADPTEQPFAVQWNDHATSLDDGNYWVADLDAKEMESDFAGVIEFSAQMMPAK